MSFDELWRLNAGEEPMLGDSVVDTERSGLSDGSIYDSYALDDLDEAEVCRFLKWLEESLMFNSPDGHSTGS